MPSSHHQNARAAVVGVAHVSSLTGVTAAIAQHTSDGQTVGGVSLVTLDFHCL